MEEETTSRLEEALREIDSDSKASEFIEEHRGTEYSSFSDYYIRYIGTMNMDMPGIVERAGFGEYAYQLIRGQKKPANRNYVIALCIAAGMSVKETNRALRISDHFPLSPKDARDVRIVVCINNGVNKVTDVDLALDEYGLPPLVD